MKTRTYLFYHARDFILYAFSLTLVAGATWLAFASPWPRALMLAGLLYMAITFVLKHGVELDMSSFGIIGRGVLGYPSRLFRLLRERRLSASLAPFAVALLAEVACKKYVGSDAFWSQPFPTHYFWISSLALITLYRTVILVAHLRRAATVHEILANSPWRKGLTGLSIRGHIIHGYITGVICTVCYFVPVLVFWRFFPPTYLREAILLAPPLYKVGLALKREGASFTTVYKVFAAESVIKTISGIHEDDHRSRFHFTVFHGNHHDAIPSGVIAVGASGFNEAVDRAACMLTFTNSCVVFCVTTAMHIFVSMQVHQYIPGVYPYSQFVVQLRFHHALHHYGSLRPLSLGDARSYAWDIANGYEPDNGRVKWFLDTVEKYETLEPDARAQFLRIGAAVDGPQYEKDFSRITDEQATRTARQL